MNHGDAKCGLVGLLLFVLLVAATKTWGCAVAEPPDKITLDPAQQRYFADAARVQVVCWHRQKGKDFTTAAKAVLDAMETGEDWYIVSLTQRQADATFAKCKEWAKRYKSMIGEAREVEHAERQEFDEDLDELFTFKSRELLLPNGGRVVSLPGRDPDALAGLTGNVIFTEFGLFPKGGYDHWRVVFPLATRGFRVVVISTPRGKETKFYELVSQPELYSVHLCDIHQSIAEGYVLRDQAGQPTDVDTFKKLYGDDVGWQREYECKFMGAMDALVKWALIEQAAAAGAGRPFELLRLDAADRFDPSFFAALREGPRGEHGWDIARRGDLSVLWSNQARGDVRHLTRLVLMQDCTFALQRQLVTTAMNTQPTAVGCGDSTGLGMDSNETLTATFGDRWEGVNFGGKRKSDLGSGLATAFRDQSQSLPPLDVAKFVATDVYAVQRDASKEGSVDAAGKSTLKLVESQNPLLPESHCDIAYAGALAIRAGHAVQQATLRIGFVGGGA